MQKCSQKLRFTYLFSTFCFLNHTLWKKITKFDSSWLLCFSLLRKTHISMEITTKNGLQDTRCLSVNPEICQNEIENRKYKRQMEKLCSAFTGHMIHLSVETGSVAAEWSQGGTRSVVTTLTVCSNCSLFAVHTVIILHSFILIKTRKSGFTTTEAQLVHSVFFTHIATFMI